MVRVRIRVRFEVRFRVRVRLGHSRVLVRCASGLDPKCLGSEVSWVRSVLTPVGLALWLVSGIALNEYRCE